MKLKYKVEKLENVPEEQRGFYVEAGNAFILDAEGAADASDVEHLNNRLVHAETELQGKQAEWEKSSAQLIEERKRLEARVAQLEQNRGTGANGQNGQPPVTEKNPFAKGSRNLTKQSELMKKDPAKAEALKKAAEQA